MRYLKIVQTDAEIASIEKLDSPIVVLSEETGKVGYIPAAEVDPYTAVDLGLSVKWANMNVGAESEEQAGLYFAWGDTEGFKADEASGKFSSSWYSSRPGAALTSDITADGGHDAARANMGGTWRMPTKAEMEELVNYGNRTWTTVNGVNGYKIVNSSDSSKYIFLPAAGFGSSGSVDNVGSYGGCWSSTFYNSSGSYGLGFGSGGFSLYYRSRFVGFSVRGVQS